MDFKGRSASNGWLLNYLHKPETKVLALSAAGVAALNGGVRNTLLLLITAGSTFAVKAVSDAWSYKKGAADDYFLDAYPDKPIQLDYTVVDKLLMANPPVNKLLSNASFSAAAGAGTSIAINGDPFFVGAMASTLFVYGAAEDMAIRYRIKRVLKGDWDIHVKIPPPPEAKPESAKHDYAQPAPVAVPN